MTYGLAENMVKNVKQWLDKQAKGFKFSRTISEFLRTYRNVPHTVTKQTPAEIIFGRALRTHWSSRDLNTMAIQILAHFLLVRVWARDF